MKGKRKRIPVVSVTRAGYVKRNMRASKVKVSREAREIYKVLDPIQRTMLYFGEKVIY